MRHSFICIGCPMGCELTVTQQDGTLAVTGNQCKIGDTYGKEELTNPTRNITTSVWVTGGDMPMLSVKTSRPIPKDAIMDCVRAVKQVTVAAPVEVGDIVLRDVGQTGADMVATRRIEAQGSRAAVGPPSRPAARMG